MTVLNRRDAYSAIPQLESKLSKLSDYITVEDGKIQIKIEDLYGNMASITEYAEGIEQRVEGIEDDYVTSTQLTQTKSDLTLEINEKAQVFTSQPTTPYYVGDLWTQGPNGEIYRCKTNRLSGNYTASDWEKASDYTDDTTATTEANARKTIVRAFNGGVITAYQGNSKGVYINASGSVDIVNLTWSGNTPTVGSSVASYGSTSTIGDPTDGMNMRINSSSQGLYYKGLRLFRMTPNYYSDNASAVTLDFGLPLSNIYARIFGGDGLLQLTSSSTLTLRGSSVSVLCGMSVSGGISATGAIDCSSVSASSGTFSSTGDAVTADNGYIKNKYAMDHIGSGDLNLHMGPQGRILATTKSSRRYKNSIAPIELQELDPHHLYDVDVVQFKFNTDYLKNEEDIRYDKPVPGFIAEQVHEQYPIAVELDENGRPDNWNDRYIIPPMLALIQEQNERIKALERRFA